VRLFSHVKRNMVDFLFESGVELNPDLRSISLWNAGPCFAGLSLNTTVSHIKSVPMRLVPKTLIIGKSTARISS
jgi:hypothetical protein